MALCLLFLGRSEVRPPGPYMSHFNLETEWTEERMIIPRSSAFEVKISSDRVDFARM